MQGFAPPCMFEAISNTFNFGQLFVNLLIHVVSYFQLLSSSIDKLLEALSLREAPTSQELEHEEPEHDEEADVASSDKEPTLGEDELRSLVGKLPEVGLTEGCISLHFYSLPAHFIEYFPLYQN